jgi:glutathione synthase/RimK-type ligase-like ATP-grasp enzyme
VIIKALDRGLVNTEAGERHYFTSSLDEAAIEDLTDIGPEPLYLQELIPKAHDVRVTVIGDSAYAARIESQNLAQAEIDWRRGPPGSVPHSAESLPKEVARLCVQLTQAYGLSFAAIDLVCRPQGDYVFLELNPNGQWAWVEQLTGLPLRARLADLLLGADG